MEVGDFLLIMSKWVILFFIRSTGTSIDCGLCETKDCHANENKFLEKRNFKCYYIRIIKEEEGIEWWDVGSYTEFFYIVEDEKVDKFLQDKKIAMK